MDRINGAGHVNHRFVTEDPATNRPPTEITDVWLNGIQEELATFIEEQGDVLSVGDPSQVAKAIKKLFQKASPSVAVAAGTADAITAVFTPQITTDTVGRIPTVTLSVIAQAANSGSGLTIDVGTGAFGVVKGAGAAIAAGDIPGAGHLLVIRGVRGVNAAGDRWVLLNPATGIVLVTAVNDASYSDNSSKPASTSWIRGAMSAIATAAGFAISLAANGYIKFPSWLGGLVVQWAIVTTNSSGIGTLVWPINFPHACFGHVAQLVGSGSPLAWITTLGAAGTAGTTALVSNTSGAGQVATVCVFSIGC